MKKLKLLWFCCALIFVTSARAQDVPGVLNLDTALASKVSNMLTGNAGGLSTAEITNGLKEALHNGVTTGAAKLSATDGFFKNAAVKILLPPEAKKLEKTLRSAGLNKPVDDAILSLNRAAEDAAKSAIPIFLEAIQQISIQDAVGILKGSDTAAMVYLKSKSSAALTTAFTPIIATALDKAEATKHWSKLVTTYNQLPFATGKANPNLAAYVTGKAIDGIFYEIAQQEAQIRHYPAARTSDLLKRVFGQ